MNRPRRVLVSVLAAGALAVVLVVTLASRGSSTSTVEADASGSRLFNQAGCSDCHSLMAAAARGRVGPDLDAIAPTYEQVAEQVRDGGGQMPAFAGKLSEKEIAALADFVSSSSQGVTDPQAATKGAKFTPDDTKLASCNGAFLCMEQAFGNLVYELGPKDAFAKFDHAIATDPEVEQNCHRISHRMGAAALLHFKGSVGRAFAAGSASCWSGYYHGILERAFADVDPNEVGQVSNQLCVDSEVRTTSFLAYQCVHGLGHGLMIYTNLDLPESLAICDELKSDWDATACTGGVFMENLSTSYGVASTWLRDDDPMYPCTVVTEKHKLYCYLMVTSRILPFVGWDYAKASKWCRKSDDGWVATCFQSLGRDSSGQTRGNVPQLLANCAKAGDMARECVYGAVRDLTSQDSGSGRSRHLCDAAPKGMRGYCYRGIGTIISDMNPEMEDRVQECQNTTTNRALQKTCREGAGVFG